MKQLISFFQRKFSDKLVTTSSFLKYIGPIIVFGLQWPTIFLHWTRNCRFVTCWSTVYSLKSLLNSALIRGLRRKVKDWQLVTCWSSAGSLTTCSGPTVPKRFWGLACVSSIKDKGVGPESLVTCRFSVGRFMRCIGSTVVCSPHRLTIYSDAVAAKQFNDMQLR